MATDSSSLGWRTPRTEEKPVGLQFMRSQSVETAE